MIDAARAALMAIDARRDELDLEEDALEQLCLAWESHIRLVGGQELLDELMAEVERAREARTEQPPADPDGQSGAARSAAPVSGSEDPPAVSMSAVASSPPGGDPPAPIESPGSARSGESRRARHGRRAPAANAATAPSSSSSGSVGTSTPASHPRPIVSCPECDWTGRALGVHRRHRHGHRAAQPHRKPKPTPEPVDPAVARRRRQAAEASPRAAVVKRVGDQVQCPSCRDLFVDEVKLQRHREISHGLRADGHSESFLCNRCPAAFATREERDTHQATHPADPVVLTVGRDTSAQRQVGSGVQIA